MLCQSLTYVETMADVSLDEPLKFLFLPCLSLLVLRKRFISYIIFDCVLVSDVVAYVTNKVNGCSYLYLYLKMILVLLHGLWYNISEHSFLSFSSIC